MHESLPSDLDICVVLALCDATNPASPASLVERHSGNVPLALRIGWHSSIRFRAIDQWLQLWERIFQIVVFFGSFTSWPFKKKFS